MKTRPPSYPDETIKEWHDAHVTGVSIRQVAERFDVPVTSVLRSFRRLNLPTVTPRPYAGLDEDWEDLYVNHMMTIKTIASIYGAATSTVRRRLLARGVEFRKRTAKTLEDTCSGGHSLAEYGRLNSRGTVVCRECVSIRDYNKRWTDEEYRQKVNDRSRRYRERVKRENAAKRRRQGLSD